MKMLDEVSSTHIHRLLTNIWEKEELPEGWNVAVVCPIHKKGDPQICNNYRGIALLNLVYKILSYCILDRVKPIAEEILGDYQGGFRPNMSTTDQIFSLRQIIEKSWEFNKSILSVAAAVALASVAAADVVDFDIPSASHQQRLIRHLRLLQHSCQYFKQLGGLLDHLVDAFTVALVTISVILATWYPDFIPLVSYRRVGSQVGNVSSRQF
ncbi:Reverse transcriptase domain [Cinara cedri]|uniref:Reverse transcriptase domain n=1 Tax=Cinara cedri TaxID=506608 RepID=A0A5E4M6Y8_9HEMI|nr:Reverse transcriptase domain [Cinara cedri]